MVALMPCTLLLKPVDPETWVPGATPKYGSADGTNPAAKTHMPASETCTLLCTNSQSTCMVEPCPRMPHHVPHNHVHVTGRGCLSAPPSLLKPGHQLRNRYRLIRGSRRNVNAVTPTPQLRSLSCTGHAQRAEVNAALLRSACKRCQSKKTHTYSAARRTCHSHITTRAPPRASPSSARARPGSRSARPRRSRSRRCPARTGRSARCSARSAAA